MAILRALSLATVFTTGYALNNGYGRTPQLGYNSYNDVGCSPNATQMSAAINAMKSKGFLQLGYNVIQLDCGWAADQRLSNGSFTYDTSVFPNGLRPLSDQARGAGFKWGMYTDLGYNMCDTVDFNRPGSLGYESQDSAYFASLNAEVVKLDNCFADQGVNAPHHPRTDFVSRYSKMSNALQNVGIKGIQFCQWGVPYDSGSGLQGPAQWAPPISTSFRMSDDIAQGWSNIMRITNQGINLNLRGLNGPGQFIDMDLLEVGNPGMSLAEQKTHFATWSAFKSVLMISTNIPGMSSDTMNILSNKDILAVNQDSQGAPVKLVQRYTDNYDLYIGPLANGNTVVYAFDTSNKARTITLNLGSLNISSASIKDLWTGKTTTGSSFTKAIDAHDNVLLVLSNVKKTTPTAPKQTFYQASAGSLAGGAAVASCSGCSGGNKVGYVGKGGSVTISNVRTSQASQDVLFDYINCETGYDTDNPTYERRAVITVNNAAPVTVSFPFTGYNWDTDLIKSYRVWLSGFSTSAVNTIKIAGVDGGTYAPDFDRFALIA